MLKKLLIGGAVVVGGYYVYTRFIKPKVTATSTTPTNAVYDPTMYREGSMPGGFSGARIEIAR